MDGVAIGFGLEELPNRAYLHELGRLGLQILDGCRSTGLRVPEHVAVIGVDDDALLCGLCDPPLSSVIPNPPPPRPHQTHDHTKTAITRPGSTTRCGPARR